MTRTEYIIELLAPKVLEILSGAHGLLALYKLVLTFECEKLGSEVEKIHVSSATIYEISFIAIFPRLVISAISGKIGSDLLNYTDLHF